MTNRLIDLRSDTVTKPTPDMRKAIASAEVGDDVIDVDPTVEKLEARTAELLGKEKAIFMPSGSMSNQIAVRIHCKPGDEFICESGCHIYNYEQGGYAQLSGVCPRTVDGEHGVMRLDQLENLIRPTNDHLVRTRLVCIENTHNRGAGRVQPYDFMADICDWAKANGLRTHLDGARLFNAVAASGIPADKWSKQFDTVSVCFSKGLGAPVGSALVGPSEMIKEARRHRKLFGGGMRQAGILAAGALYALENHRERLNDDHTNAQIIADGVRSTDGLRLSPANIDTNIVIFVVDPRLGTAAQFAASLLDAGVWVLPIGPTKIRAVTHLDVSHDDVRRAAALIQEVANQVRGGKHHQGALAGTY